ncbi:HIRAN domain-containing protein [Methyloversatilis universalis]|uniref:HIRAN domain-containing protein n=1 Tax=Methyloversatilis universalis TaxID=378211 RepID=UPI000366A3A2|nr:HIRAN domain-containing protein [Methyloversatilis universalis]
MRSVFSLCALLCLTHAAHAGDLRMLAQRSPLAGAQFHRLAEVWPQLSVGDPLTLEREPDNRHDRRAVRVLWRGVMIGYLPRAANFEAADEMDAGARLSARIGRLAPDPDPWKRLRVDVWVELAR